MHLNAEYILVVLYFVAITADAMTAALAAGRRSMDWMGVAMLGPITALGGGSMRDMLFGRYPLTWVDNPNLLLITAGASLATIAIARYMHHLRKLFLLLDAIGLVAFSVIGCNIALAMNLPFIIVIASGMITGCVGGVLRDVLCADIPLLFRTELYATVSIFTGLLYVGGQRFGVPHDLSIAVAMALGLTLRMLALRFGWSMPKFVYTHTLH